MILGAAEAWKMKLMYAMALSVLNEFSFSENVSQEDNPRREGEGWCRLRDRDHNFLVITDCRNVGT